MTAGREVVAHVAAALTRYIRSARIDGVTVPREVHLLAVVLTDCVQVRQPATVPTSGADVDHGESVNTLLLTKSEAAQALRCSVRTVDRLIAAQSLPSVKLESSTRIRRVDLDAFVGSLTQRDLDCAS